jgi:hypothetical protein
MPEHGHTNEHTHLLARQLHGRRLSAIHDEEAHSIIVSHVSKEEAALAGSTVGERLPYNDYTTIDWLHDLVHTLRERQIYTTDTYSRSKIRIDGVPSTFAKAFAPLFTPHSTPVRHGSP